jgi:hypothetical protein
MKIISLLSVATFIALAAGLASFFSMDKTLAASSVFFTFFFSLIAVQEYVPRRRFNLGTFSAKEYRMDFSTPLILQSKSAQAQRSREASSVVEL